MIKILHISDLHFYKDAQTYNMREILIGEARDGVQNVPKGHKLLVVTGDFHNFNDKDYKMAESFLNQLIEAMDIERAEDVFVVPGNHDVGNDKMLKASGIDPLDAKAYTKMLKDGNMEYVEKKLQAYSPYCTFVRQMGFYPDSVDSMLPARAHVRQWQGVRKLNILHLNTTLSADGTPDKSNQTTDTTTASDSETWKKYLQPDIPAIALGHNHFYDLKETDQLALKTTFSLKNISAYLCGDTHLVEQDTRNQMIALRPGPKQGRLEIPNLICAKSIGDKEDDYSDFGYYWHEWDENTGNVNVVFRRWKPGYGPQTAHDETADGFYRMRPFPSKRNPQKTNGSNHGKNPDSLKKYLDNCLIDIRNNHPSFKLMDKDAIDERLFPGVKEQYLSEAFAKESDNGPTSPVWKLIQSYWNTPRKRNIVIQGDGGIGKTVTLLSITSSANAVLHAPAIYIPLHNLVSKEGQCQGISSFLKQKYPEYYDEIGKLAAGSWENGPKLLLLLDGFNEVPVSQRSEILRNIKDWDNAHPGTQMIAVSRPTTGISLQELSGDPVEVTLEPLRQENVRAYLKDWKIAIPKDSSPVWKVLIYPLFLTLYVKTGKLKNLKSDGYSLAPKQAESGGALIWNFLQRELLRISSEDWVLRCALACEYIIPFIAYHMAKKQQFIVSRQEAMEYIDKAIKELDITMLPRHLDKLYQEYQNRHFSIPSFNDINWYATVLQDTGMLVPRADSSMYIFMHQSFRDCLAGLHLVNQMEMAEKSTNYPQIWQESHHPDLIKYASELMEQETFANHWEKNRVLRPTHHTGTINLLEIRKYRKDWGELDFSGMNLCDLNLGRYMCNDQFDLHLFRRSQLTVDTQINKATFQSEGHGGFVNCIAVTLDGLCISGSSDTTLHVCDSHSGECLHILEGHKGDVKCIVITPAGLCISGSADNTLRVWDPHTGECLHVLEGHTSEIRCVGVTPDGLCISGSADNTLRVWDPLTGECLHVLEEHTAGIHCIGVTADGLCISGSEDDTLRVWDLHTGVCLHVIGVHKEGNLDIAITQNGLCVSGWGTYALCIWDPHTGECLRVLMEQLLTFYHVELIQDELCIGADRNTLYIWDLNTGEKLHIIKGHEEHINCIAITPDGMCISGSYDKTLRIWDPHTGECKHLLEGHNGYVTCVAITPDGLCISGSWDFTLRVWNPHNGECLHVLEGRKDDIIYVALTPDRLCVSVTWDHRLCIWDLHSGKCLYTLEGHKDYVFSCATTSDGLCISGSCDKTLRVWNLHTGECLHILEGHTNDVFDVAATSDDLCISGSKDNTLRVWDPRTGECLRVLEGHKKAVFDVIVTSDGLCVSGSADKSLRVWDPHTGECLHVLEGHKKSIHDIAVTPDGLCVSKSEDRTLRVWDLHSGECLYILQKPKKEINDVAVTPDGLCIGGLSDNTLCIWDLHSGKCSHILKGHTRAVACVAVTPDGLCVSGSEDNTLRVWNPQTGECLRVLEGHKDCVTHAVVISEELCVSGSSDNTLRVWDLHSGKCIYVLEKMGLNIQEMNLSESKIDMELKMILPINGVIV